MRVPQNTQALLQIDHREGPGRKITTNSGLSSRVTNNSPRFKWQSKEIVEQGFPQKASTVEY